MVGDKNTMTTGAGSSIMHSLHGSNAGTATIRLLKTSPVNALLNASYNSDRQSSAVWGQNVIQISNIVSGDVTTLSACAFKKQAPLNYANDGGTMEWAFDVGHVDENLG